MIGSLEADSALKVALTIGARTRHAQLQGISLGGRDLEFYYTVRADDRDADGISIAAGELLRDSVTVTAWADSNIEAALTHETVAADANRKVDGSRVRAPRVSSIIYHVTQDQPGRRAGDRCGGRYGSAALSITSPRVARRTVATSASREA